MLYTLLKNIYKNQEIPLKNSWPFSQTEYQSKTVILSLCTVIKMDCTALSQAEHEHFPAVAQATGVIKNIVSTSNRGQEVKIHTHTPPKFSMLK